MLIIVALVTVVLDKVELVIVEFVPSMTVEVSVELEIKALVVVLFVISEFVVVPPVICELVEVELFNDASIIPPPDTKELLEITELVASVFRRVLLFIVLPDIAVFVDVAKNSVEFVTEPPDTKELLEIVDDEILVF